MYSKPTKRKEERTWMEGRKKERKWKAYRKKGYKTTKQIVIEREEMAMKKGKQRLQIFDSEI